MSLATVTSSASMAMITPSLTTTFIPSMTACAENRVTMLANRAYQIWMNAPVPVPGTTVTDCYPSQFMSSLLLSAGSVTQPAFNPLVCPQHYSAVGPYTSNYIACCPSSYSFAQPDTTVFKDRPAFGGTCYSNIDMATPVLVTAYGSAGVTATSYFTATVTNAQAYAYPIDGYAFGVKEVESKNSGLGQPTPSSDNTASNPAATTYTVLSGQDGQNSAFIPKSVVAKVGDTVVFQFTSGNHTVTESTFDRPCDKLENGIDSGYQPVTNPPKSSEFAFIVSRTASQWFYSKQTGECDQGMTFALNPSNEQTQVLFQSKAQAQSHSTGSSGPSTGVKVGASIAAVAGVGILAIIAFFLIRRRRQNSRATAQENMRDTTIHKTRDDSTYTDTEAGMSPMSQVKPILPYKGQELHGNSSVPELVAQRPPAELMERGPPVEMYSPQKWDTQTTMYPDRKHDLGLGRRY